jgi:hypothetical protein
MNIPTATDAKAAAVENRARKQQAALDKQAALIERRIQECIADGMDGFNQIGKLDPGIKDQLKQKGYRCTQTSHYDGSYYSIEWDAPNLPTV